MRRLLGSVRCCDGDIEFDLLVLFVELATKLFRGRFKRVNSFARYMSGIIQASGIWNDTLFYVIVPLSSLDNVGTSLNLEHCCACCPVALAAR